MQAQLTLDDLTPEWREGIARNAYRAYASCGAMLTEDVLRSARGVLVKKGAMFTMSDGRRVFAEFVPFEAIDLPELEGAA